MNQYIPTKIIKRTMTPTTTTPMDNMIPMCLLCYAGDTKIKLLDENQLDKVPSGAHIPPTSATATF